VRQNRASEIWTAYQRESDSSLVGQSKDISRKKAAAWLDSHQDKIERFFRTRFSVFVGVLGPVRTGKSTFIKRFMEICVIPNIENVYRRERAIDELPQSGSGRTIMTAEPKFVLEEAVEVALDGTPRMVMTPWMDHEIPMAEAVEIGTRKAIQEHSTVGIVITTDGSVTDIPREDYLEAEERVITELQELGEEENISLSRVRSIDLGKGVASAELQLPRELFYETLSSQSGSTVADDGDLMSLLTELAAVKANYDKVSAALSNVYDTGYGIVMPTMEELELEEPEVMRQGGRYGIKLKASAPSIHMFKVDIESTVSPIVGNEKQSEDMVNYLMEKFSGDPTQIWESNIFGRSFHELVNEDLQAKLYRMPMDARLKFQETLQRIVNEGSGGLICIIL
jgi:hypothetical protein